MHAAQQLSSLLYQQVCFERMDIDSSIRIGRYSQPHACGIFAVGHLRNMAV